ncbi:MAG: GH92 family glycosyl hydrolase [Bacteroidota bacterium]
MKKLIFRFSLVFISLIFVLAGCSKKPADYVNPMVGTGGHGHTFPGACLPFGMVQLSPDTRLEGWDGCSGYHYSDSIMYGFSHTHLSGTGCSDYGDILLMPTTGEGTFKNTEYASAFSHQRESAEPGYYKVKLDKYNITAELTATKRSGFHKYTYPKDKERNVVLDLKHRDEVISSEIDIVNDREVSGYRRSKAWAQDQVVYFHIQFSKPFIKHVIARNDSILQEKKNIIDKNLKAVFTFTPDERPLFVKCGISAVSKEGALKNLQEENPDWRFKAVRNAAMDAWNQELSKIEIEGGTEDQKKNFYTSLYHSMISPNVFSDVDGKYPGRDKKIHTASGYNQYTVFSLWDTYRALHPLFTIIDQKRTLDFIKTFLTQYQQGGRLPVWELAANETDCMIGYHSVSVIADAYIKGIRGFDEKLALEAMKFSANRDELGLKYYKTLGFIPSELESESVSKTAEYAYDDWCIAQFAKAMGDQKTYEVFIKRAQYYKNLYDPESGFLRAKINNAWFAPFDPYEVNFNYTEANAWQYCYSMPQDLNWNMNQFCCVKSFEANLDQLFSAKASTSGRDQADITGLIGQYAHGNEPSHHMAYLYNYTGSAWKTQKLVQQIMREFYKPTPDGLIGNEDCGQMSAWYVLSAMGIYPVTPGSDIYVFGSPIFDKVTMHLENGNEFTIRARRAAPNNIYIRSAELNGSVYTKSYIRHSDIMKGGELVYDMSPVPNKKFGNSCAEDLPESSITENLIEPVPYVATGSRVFIGSFNLSLQSLNEDSKIYYRISSDSTWHHYTKPIPVESNCALMMKSVSKNNVHSPLVYSQFLKIPKNRKITLQTKYANQYNAGGVNALIDFIRGSADFRNGSWQGYEGMDIIAIIDLYETQNISKISMGCLQDVNSWIFFPVKVSFSTSANGKNFTLQKEVKPSKSPDEWGTFIEELVATFPVVKAKYIKVEAKNMGVCPAGHPGAGKPSWIFADEISIQ